MTQNPTTHRPTIHDRSALVWPVLVHAALNRQTLTYKRAAQVIGTSWRRMGHVLRPIYDYCQQHNLPSLNILAVNAGSGETSYGMLWGDDKNWKTGPAFQRERVYRHGEKWFRHHPTAQDFRRANPNPVQRRRG